MALIVHRRDTLALGLGAAAAMAVGAGTSAFAANDANEVMQKFFGRQEADGEPRQTGYSSRSPKTALLSR